jgi:gliding motility-associated-like protein
MNDRFNLLRSDNVEVLDFKVWNRWGQLVYENDSNDFGWDGTKDGNPAAVDVYVYSIKYRFGEIEETLTGELTLLR